MLSEVISEKNHTPIIILLTFLVGSVVTVPYTLSWAGSILQMWQSVLAPLTRETHGVRELARLVF